LAWQVGGSSLAAGTTTAAQLTTFVLYVDMVVSSSLAVCEQWAQVLEAVGASERVMELLQLTPSKQVLTTPQCNRLS
jgi:ABC-type multidrug transport system fused ATPase/permease subunit